MKPEFPKENAALLYCEEPAGGPSMQILVVLSFGDWCEVDLWKLRLERLPSLAGGAPLYTHVTVGVIPC